MKSLFLKLRFLIATHPSEAKLFSIAVILRICSYLLLSYRYGVETLWFSNEDAIGYLNMAQHLSRGDGFMMNGMVTAVRTPLYPIFLSFFDILHLPPLMIVVVQIVIFSISVVVLYRIGLFLFNKNVAFWAALLMAVEPYLITLPNLATTETVFIFLCLVATLYMAKAVFTKERVYKRLIIAGIFWSLAILCRPVALYVLFPMLVVIIVADILNREKFLVTIKKILLFILIMVAVLFPWSLRQKIVFNSWKVSTIDTFMLITRVAPIAVSERDGISYYDALPVVLREDLPERIPGFSVDVLENTFDYEKPVNKYLSELFNNHWRSVIKVYIYSSTSALFGTGYDYLLTDYGLETELKREGYTQILLSGDIAKFIKMLFQPTLQQFSIILGASIWLLFYGLILLDVLSCRKPKEIIRLLFVIIIAGYFVFFSLGPSAHARYRVPAYPFLFLLVGHAVSTIIDKVRDRNSIKV